MSETPNNPPTRRRFQRLTKAEISLFAAPALVLLLVWGAGLFSRQGDQEKFPSTPQVFVGHLASVYAVTVSPDSKTIASGSEDATVRLWDAGTGAALLTLTGHKDSIMSVAFSPDGRTLASGSPDNTVRLWDVRTGKSKKALQAGSMVRSVAFSPDGKLLAAGSNDWKVRLWQVKSGRLLRTFTGHKRGLFSVAFSPDGRTLTTGDESGLIHLWSVKTGKRLRSLDNADGVFALSYSRDGRLLAVAAPQQGVRVWDMQTFEEVSHWHRTGDGYYAQAVAFAPDNKTVATGSDNLELCDARTGSQVRLFSEPKAYVQAVAFSPDGKILVSGNDDGTVKVWHLR